MSIFETHVRVADNTATSPVIVHAPHGGRAIPDRFRPAFSVSDAELGAELNAMTDHFTDAIASAVADVSVVVNGLSRFVVDVERFDDDSEEMNAVGMGVRYTHGSRGQLIRVVPESDVAPLKRFFNDYSDTLSRFTDAALAQHGRALIIDLHSFPQVALPYELHSEQARPQLCIGFDEFHASEGLLAEVASAFDWLDQVPNEPFQGAYVPMAHYRRDARVQAVMLEIRRDTYMDEVAVLADAAACARISASVAHLAAGFVAS